MKKSVDLNDLEDWQVCNQFGNTDAIHKKTGLTKSLADLPADYTEPHFVPVDAYLPKSFVIQKPTWSEYFFNSEFDDGIASFTREYRIVFAETILKNFDGHLTPQVLVSLKIADKRLADPNYNITEAEWSIIQKPDSQVSEEDLQAY